MTDPTDSSEHPSRRRPIFVWAERLLTLGLLIFVFVRLTPQLEALTGVGPDRGKAPRLDVITLSGDSIGPAQLSGKVVVVNFWATWCMWCRLEMPSLEHLYERHAGDGLVVLGLDADASPGAPVREFLKKRGITYPVARATAAEEGAFGGIHGIPTTFVLDRTGVIRYRVVGYFAPPALEAAVARLLDERGSVQEAR